MSGLWDPMASAAERRARRRPLIFVAEATIVVIAVVVGCWLLYRVRAVALTVFLGFFLALGLDPMLRALEKRGFRRGQAVLMLLLALVLFLVFFFYLTLRPAVTQLQDLAENLPQLINDVSDSNTTIGRFLSRPDVSSRISGFLGQAPSLLFSSLGRVFGVVGAFLGSAFTTLTVVTLMIYFMLALPRMRVFADKAVGTPARARVMEEALGKVGGYVTGQLAICLTAGVVSYVFFLIAGVPYAAVLAIAVAVLDGVPQVGATLGAVVATLVALTASVPLAIATFVFFLIYQQVENYLIAPRMFAKAVNLSPVAVFVAILVGARLSGVVGALVALPVTAALKSVFGYALRDRLAMLGRSGESASGSGPRRRPNLRPHLPGERRRAAEEEDPVHAGEAPSPPE